MKTLTCLAAVLLLSTAWVSAQDVTGFKAPTQPGAPTSSKGFPNPNVRPQPEVGGIFADGVKHGPVLISPTAPASYGMGEKYLSAPSTRWDLQHESGPAAHRTAGGLKLVSFEF